jgi:hypothetical protein
MSGYKGTPQPNRILTSASTWESRISKEQGSEHPPSKAVLVEGLDKLSIERKRYSGQFSVSMYAGMGEHPEVIISPRLMKDRGWIR